VRPDALFRADSDARWLRLERAFIIGYDDPDLDPTLAAAPRLTKPFSSAEIEDMLRQLLEGRAKPPLMQQLQAWRD